MNGEDGFTWFQIVIAAMLFAMVITNDVHSSPLDETRCCHAPVRNADGSIKRSTTVLHHFQQIHPCPSTGLTNGACPRVGPGYASGFTPPNSTASNVHLNSVASGKYTPTWSSSGGANNIGNGTLEGWYNKSGKMVTATVELSIGVTTTVSADYYSFTLPSSARADKGWNCTGSYYDASTSTSYVFSGYVVRSGSNNTVRLFVNGVAGSPYVSSTIPVVPAVNDYLTFTIAYEEA